MKSDNINELAAALSKAQAEIRGAVKDATNPFYKTKYADLTSTWEACRHALTKNNLCVIQTPEVTEKGLILITTLAHSSGQWICGAYPVEPIKKDPQGVGAALTYARRYSLAAIVGVTTEDDDGESSMERRPQPQAKPPQATSGYLIPFGKSKGKRLDDFKSGDLLAFANLVTEAIKKNGPNPEYEEFLKQVDRFFNGVRA